MENKPLLIGIDDFEDERKEDGYADVVGYGTAFYRKDCRVKVRQGRGKSEEW